MFLGSAPNHAQDVFRFLNLATNKVIVRRNVIWLGKCYGDWKKLKPFEIEYVADDDDQEQGRAEEADGGMDEDEGNDVQNKEEEEEEEDHVSVISDPPT
jgi:hypothetical protein